MIKVSTLCILTAVIMPGIACASYDAEKFQSEIRDGLDLISARATADVVPEPAPGELGLEVYEVADAVQSDDMKLFIPTSMYLRLGGGLNLGFATDYAHFEGRDYESSGSYTTQIGLGWNLSSYVRSELDYQGMTMTFSGLGDDMRATYQTVGGMLYFDFARRYVQTGDVMRRRTFVPYMGIGAGFGYYEFQGVDGADGFVIAAPRAALGFNIMLTDLFGIDIAYQYQMMIGNGFGWGVRSGGVDNISNIMASVRMNF